MLSIIVIVYNLEKYIKVCLESLNDQISRNFEVIIVNDGSTDNSKGIIKLFIEQHNLQNFKLVNKKNQGMSLARSTGLTYIKGDYVYFLDGDNYISNSLVSKFDENSIKQSDIYFFKYYTILENYISITKTANINAAYFKNLSAVAVLEEYIYKKKYSLDFAIEGMIFKQSFLKKNKINFKQHTSPHEDTEFIFKSLLQFESMTFINEILSYYLIRDGSTMRSLNMHRFDSFYAYQRIIRYMSSTRLNIDEKFKTKLSNRFNILAIRAFLFNYVLAYNFLSRYPTKLTIKNFNKNLSGIYITILDDLDRSILNIKNLEFSFLYLSTILAYIVFKLRLKPLFKFIS